MLFNCWLKDHKQTAKDCLILYPKFHILFKNFQRNIAAKFVSTLMF